MPERVAERVLVPVFRLETEGVLGTRCLPVPGCTTTVSLLEELCVPDEPAERDGPEERGALGAPVGPEEFEELEELEEPEGVEDLVKPAGVGDLGDPASSNERGIPDELEETVEFGETVTISL